MAITMRTNMASLDGQRNLLMNQKELDDSMRKLASGYRITRASDDAAGLAISEKMRKQIRGTNQAIRNANDGISVIQTADGGLGEIENIVQRIRQLAVQASNGTLVTEDHVAVQREMQQIKSEIDEIAARTKFNGIDLLGPNADTMTLQIGADEGETLDVALKDFSSTTELSSFAAYTLSYANDSSTLTASDYQERAMALIGSSDSAIEKINNQRAVLGAVQNRLEHTIAVQQVASDNLSAADSRIRDVDVAAESAKMAKANILMQAGVSVLSQANQQPQMALKLLGG